MLKIDKNNKVFLEAIKTLLAQAVFNPTPEKLDTLIAEYLSLDNHALYIKKHDDVLVGIIGCLFLNTTTIIIRHIAVSQHYQRQGIARTMMNEIMEATKVTQLYAETDNAAVGFYQACGFEVTLLPEKYPGIQRYQCVLRDNRNLKNKGK